MCWHSVHRHHSGDTGWVSYPPHGALICHMGYSVQLRQNWAPCEGTGGVGKSERNGVTQRPVVTWHIRIEMHPCVHTPRGECRSNWSGQW